MERKEKKNLFRNRTSKANHMANANRNNNAIAENNATANVATRTIQNTIKKSSLGAGDTFDYEKLVSPLPCFLPCSFEEELEEVTFTYDISGKKPVSDLLYEEKEAQYQFLLNFPMIESLIASYHVQLTEENIFYDENLLPYIKQRDLYAMGMEKVQGAFLEQYKIFIGGILSKKYDVKTLQESGLSLLEQVDTFKEYYKAQSVEELQEILWERMRTYKENLKATTLRVKKKTNKVKTIVSIAASVLLIGVGVYAGYVSFFEMPAKEKVIGTYEGYVAKDTVASIDSMKGVSVEEMDESTKYVLAVSYAKGESMKQDEIAEIVEKLSINSNEKELEYWIHLGRLESKEAQSMAKALSNDQLLFYAYMKELNYLETNTKIDGEEKEGRMSQLEQEIEKLGEKYSTEEETGDKAVKDTAETDTGDKAVEDAAVEDTAAADTGEE